MVKEGLLHNRTLRHEIPMRAQPFARNLLLLQLERLSCGAPHIRLWRLHPCAIVPKSLGRSWLGTFDWHDGRRFYEQTRANIPAFMHPVKNRIERSQSNF
eukprot:4007753-Pleurochrysis_carterae.AAC.1